MKKYITIKGRKIDIEDFKQTCIECYTIASIAQYYNCGSTTITNKVREAFPELPRANRTPLGYKLLELEGKMRCYVCKEIYSYTEYSTNTYNKNGLSKECKKCAKIHNTSDSKKETDKRYRVSLEGRNIRASAEAKRRASKLDRTPKWASTEKIKEFYRNRPDGYEVDHIIPLQGDLVCGLHVENNLQYLKAEENRSKSNKFTPM